MFSTMSQWRTMFIYFLFLCRSSEVGSQTVPTDTANNAVDLLIMVDCSYYITQTNFRTVLNSVANFIDTLPLGPSEVHVAALSYSTVINRSDFTFNKTTAKEDVQKLFYDGRAALTHAAFDEAYIVMTSRRSLRPGARKVVILITEGFALYPSESRRSADILLNSGVEVWAVGIGPYIRDLELWGYTTRLSRVILWDRFDVLPPISLGLSNPASVTDSPTATPRIQPSTTSLLVFTSEEAIKSTPTTVASPDTTVTQFMTATLATSISSGTLRATADMTTSATARGSIIPIQSTYMDRATHAIPAVVTSASLSATPAYGFYESVVPSTSPKATPRYMHSSEASWSSIDVNPTYIHRYDESSSFAAVSSLYSTPISLAPTPTQTSLQVSSTVAVDVPWNNTTDDKIDDGSVVFNSSDKEGLCYKAAASKGFGFVPHPRDCDKFLQCHRSANGTVTASVRLCPPGQFWKQANLTCVSSVQACCQDPCEKRSDGQTFRMDGGCSRYWECSKGVSMAMKCPIFQAYISGKGCVIMPICVDSDKSKGSCDFSGKCESLPLRNNSGYRIQTLSGPFDFTCWASTEFDLASCSCRPMKKLSTCCHLVTLLSETSEVITDTAVVYNAMAEAGCPAVQISDNQTKVSTTNCSSGQSHAAEPMRDVTLHFRYLTSNNPSSFPQVLVKSRACVPARGGILVVSEDRSSLDVMVLSSTGYALTASLPLLALNRTAWWDVHVQYSGGDVFLELTAANLVYHVYSKGGPHIPVGACGWKVGEPEELSDHLSKLAGNITDVLVSRCSEYGF